MALQASQVHLLPLLATCIKHPMDRTEGPLVGYLPTSHLQPCSATEMPGEWVPLSQNEFPASQGSLSLPSHKDS